MLPVGAWHGDPRFCDGALPFPFPKEKGTASRAPTSKGWGAMA